MTLENRLNHQDFDPNIVINDEQFEDMRDLLEDDFADLVKTFLTDCHQRLSVLNQAQQDNDNALGFETAHAMKGASANLGAELLMRLSSDFQEACRNQTISDLSALITKLSEALIQTETAVNQRLGSL